MCIYIHVRMNTSGRTPQGQNGIFINLHVSIYIIPVRCHMPFLFSGYGNPCSKGGSLINYMLSMINVTMVTSDAVVLPLSSQVHMYLVFVIIHSSRYTCTMAR